MKKIAIWMLFLLLSVISLPQTTFAATNTTPKEAYELYYELLADKVATVGCLQPSTLEAMIGPGSFYLEKPGIIYAKLVDFDNNGLDELFIIESVLDNTTSELSKYQDFYKERWYVYEYKNNALTCIAATDNDLVEETWGFVTDKNGKTCLYTSPDNSTDDYTFYEFINQTRIRKTSLWVTFSPNWSINGTFMGQKVDVHSNEGKGYYNKLVDNQPAPCTGPLLVKTRDEIAAGGEELYDHSDNRAPDYSVQNIMRRIEQNYLDNYFTPSTWAKDSVQYAIDSNFVPKTLQRGYRRPITRAEFCKLATTFYESLKKTTITQRATFKDTTDVNVQKMAGLGVVSGVSQDNFAPNNILTREEAAAILVRLANVINVTSLDKGTQPFVVCDG